MPGIFDGWRKRRKSSAVVGKPVYLEEDGERIGVVRDVKFDPQGEPSEYMIDIDGKVTGIPRDSVMERSDGIVIEPLWYIEAKRFIRDLEVEARRLAVDADLIVKAGPLKRQEMHRLLQQKADIAPLVSRATIIQKNLLDRLHMFQEEKNKIGLDLITLEERRIMEEIDRREFLHALIDLRRKAKIAQVMIENCVVLLQKMNELPFVPTEVDIDLVSSQSFLSHPSRIGGRGEMAAEASGGMSYPYGPYPPKQEPQTPVQTAGGKMQSHGGEDAEERAKRIRKVRVLKVEKELEDLKARIGGGAGGISPAFEERIRLRIELQLKRDRLKEVNQELPALEKLLKSPELTPVMREYFQVRKELMDKAKDSLGKDVKEMNSRLSDLDKEKETAADGGEDVEPKVPKPLVRPRPKARHSAVASSSSRRREVALAKLGAGLLLGGLMLVLVGTIGLTMT